MNPLFPHFVWMLLVLGSYYWLGKCYPWLDEDHTAEAWSVLAEVSTIWVALAMVAVATMRFMP